MGEQQALAARTPEHLSLMLESDAKALLSRFGISVPRGALALIPGDAARVAAELAFPVALKILSVDIPHKTEVGAVRVGIATPEDVGVVVREMVETVEERAPEARVAGILIEEMAPLGVEVLVGILEEPLFGRVLGFGLGGVFAEAYDDVTFRALPLKPWDPSEMLEDIRGVSVLRGFRGKAPNRQKLADVLLRLAGEGGLAETEKRLIAQLELNPIVVGEDDVVVVDAKIWTRT